MNKRESNLLDDLKLAVDSPKIYLSNYFDELKNQIDLKCQMNMNEYSKINATAAHLKLIQEVDSFEQKCLANVGQLELPTKKQIEGIKEEKELYIALHQVQKQLFMNQSMIFWDIEQFKKLNLHLSNICFETSGYEHFKCYWKYTFGLLIIIEDEFIILNKKVKQMLR